MAESMQESPSDAYIATEEELEAFCRQNPSDRVLTSPLRGVVVEMAVTGLVRYPWCLVRPVIEACLASVLTQYEQQAPQVGPSLVTSSSLRSRLHDALTGFNSAPWTIQRLAELVLEPGRQYKSLAKLALALDKVVLVTGEVAHASTGLGPRPLLASLGPVNVNPPPVHVNVDKPGEARGPASEEGGLAGAALSIRNPLASSPSGSDNTTAAPHMANTMTIPASADEQAACATRDTTAAPMATDMDISAAAEEQAGRADQPSTAASADEGTRSIADAQAACAAQASSAAPMATDMDIRAGDEQQHAAAPDSAANPGAGGPAGASEAGGEGGAMDTE